MIKVLFVIWSLEKGGAERFLVSLLKHIDTKYIRPFVCCLNWKGRWAQELEQRGIPVIALNKKNGIDIKSFIRLVKLIKKEKFDIVNTYLWTADTMGRLAASLAGTPVVISTAQNVDQWKKWQHRVVDRLLSYKTDRLIAVSDAVERFYHQEIGIPLEKISVIPNAIEVNRFKEAPDYTYLYDELGLTAKDFILVCNGRLTEQKGQRYLLQSISLLGSEYPNLRVLFVGYGEDKDRLGALSKNLGVLHMIRFLGYRQDIVEILHLSNGLVLPSLYEGLPLCVLEAMAAAKPVIATKVGGAPELIADGETGFIVLPKNAQALAYAIKKLVNLPDKGRKMGQRGREIVVNNFSIESVAKKTNDLFLSLAKTKLQENRSAITFIP